MYAASFLRASAKLTTWHCSLHIVVWHNNKRELWLKGMLTWNTTVWVTQALEEMSTSAQLLIEGRVWAGHLVWRHSGKPGGLGKKSSKKKISSKYFIIRPEIQRKPFRLFSLPLSCLDLFPTAKAKCYFYWTSPENILSNTCSSKGIASQQLAPQTNHWLVI